MDKIRKLVMSLRVIFIGFIFLMGSGGASPRTAFAAENYSLEKVFSDMSFSDIMQP